MFVLISFQRASFSFVHIYADIRSTRDTFATLNERFSLVEKKLMVVETNGSGLDGSRLVLACLALHVSKQTSIIGMIGSLCRWLQIFFVALMLLLEQYTTFCRCLLSYSYMRIILESRLEAFPCLSIFFSFFFFYLHNAVIKWPFLFLMLGVLCTKVLEYRPFAVDIVFSTHTFNKQKKAREKNPIVFIYTHLL